MKGLYLFVMILVASLGAATWTLTERDAATISATWSRTNIVSLGVILKGESGTIIEQHDDWIEVDVVSSKNTNNVGKTAYIIEWILDGNTVKAPGAKMFATPASDLEGKPIKATQTGLLFAGDVVKRKGYTRPTWYLCSFDLPATKGRKEAFKGNGNVYLPYGKRKE